MQEEFEAGDVIARRYRLERPLGRGGMGVVWAATHLVTKRPVAIKVLLGPLRDDPAKRARLLREARASSTVNHEGVVAVHDVVDARGAPALVMDLLEGESLRERLDRVGRLPVEQASAMLADVARALAAAHRVGVVHRDIKPENIFLAARPAGGASVKVLDFGIAKLAAVSEAAGAAPLTQTGAMLGTPFYMSPEQAFGERDVGPPSDAWALGIVLAECIGGTRPTQAENVGQVIKKITQEKLVLRDLPANAPAALHKLLDGLLTHDARTRLSDMGSIAARLEAIAAGLEAPAGARSKARTLAVASIVAGALAIATAAVAVRLPFERRDGSRARTSREASSAPSLPLEEARRVPHAGDDDVQPVASEAPRESPAPGASVAKRAIPTARESVVPPPDTPAVREPPTSPSAKRPAAGKGIPTGGTPTAVAPSTPRGPGHVVTEAPF